MYVYINITVYDIYMTLHIYVCVCICQVWLSFYFMYCVCMLICICDAHSSSTCRRKSRTSGILLYHSPPYSFEAGSLAGLFTYHLVNIFSKWYRPRIAQIFLSGLSDMNDLYIFKWFGWGMGNMFCDMRSLNPASSIKIQPWSSNLYTSLDFYPLIMGSCTKDKVAHQT